MAAHGAATIPAGAHSKCKGGTFTEAKTTQGACSGHGGVAQWF